MKGKRPSHKILNVKQKMLANRADFGRQGRRHAANGRAAFAVLTSHTTLVAVVHDLWQYPSSRRMIMLGHFFNAGR